MTKVDSSATPISSTYYSLPTSGFNSVGISIENSNTVYSIAMGTINSDWGQIGLQVIDLMDNKATLTQVLP
jgi:hypothetical protein